MTISGPIKLLIIGSIAISTLTLLGIIPVTILLIAKSLIGILFQFELLGKFKGD